MKRYRVGFLLLFWLMSVRSSGADAKDAFNEGAMLQFGAAPLFVGSFNEFCKRDADLVSCTLGFFAAGFQADVSYRFAPAWFELGLTGGTVFELSGAQTCSESGCTDVPPAQLWRVGAEARFIPLLTPHLALFLAVEVGVAGTGGWAIRDVAPAVGGAVGLDIPVGSHFLIGFDFQGHFFGFGKASMMPADGGKVELSNSFFWSAAPLKLGARFSL